jgi:hypothetical protein
LRFVPADLVENSIECLLGPDAVCIRAGLFHFVLELV